MTQVLHQSSNDAYGEEILNPQFKSFLGIFWYGWLTRGLPDEVWIYYITFPLFSLHKDLIFFHDHYPYLLHLSIHGIHRAKLKLFKLKKVKQ